MILYVMNEIRTTKNWKKINLKDMTDEHIINCIKKIKRDGLIVKEVYCGWYAWEDSDVEIYSEEDERLIKFYEELLRRKWLNF